MCGYLSTQTGAGNPKRDERDVKVGRGVAIKKMRFTGFLALSSAKKEKRKKESKPERNASGFGICMSEWGQTLLKGLGGAQRLPVRYLIHRQKMW